MVSRICTLTNYGTASPASPSPAVWVFASVSEILGHSDKAVTLRMYTHADEASKKRASNIFRNALNNTKPDYAKNA